MVKLAKESVAYVQRTHRKCKKEKKRKSKHERNKRSISRCVALYIYRRAPGSKCRELQARIFVRCGSVKGRKFSFCRSLEFFLGGPILRRHCCPQRSHATSYAIFVVVYAGLRVLPLQHFPCANRYFTNLRPLHAHDSPRRRPRTAAERLLRVDAGLSLTLCSAERPYRDIFRRRNEPIA